MANKWRDAWTKQRVIPSGRSHRMMKDYMRLYEKEGEKPAMLRGVHPGQRDNETRRFDRRIGYQYGKSKEEGRKKSREEWDSRQYEGPGFVKDGVRRSFDDSYEKSEHEDIGPYSADEGEITYGSGFTDEERKNLPKTITHYSPEATKVRGEHTRKEAELSGPKKDIERILRNRKKRRLMAQKIKIGLLEKRGL